jgi:hypothetical protein
LSEKNYELTKQNTNLSAQLNDSSIRKQNLETQLAKWQAQQTISPRLTFEYIEVSGNMLKELEDRDPGNPKGRPKIVQSNVLSDFHRWIKKQKASIQGHSFILAHIANPGTQPANDIKLITKSRVFSPDGVKSSPINQVDATQWPTISGANVRVLEPGENVYVPLAHIDDNNHIYGSVDLPESITHENPFTGKTEMTRLPSIQCKTKRFSTGNENVTTCRKITVKDKLKFFSPDDLKASKE